MIVSTTVQTAVSLGFLEELKSASTGHPLVFDIHRESDALVVDNGKAPAMFFRKGNHTKRTIWRAGREFRTRVLTSTSINQ